MIALLIRRLLCLGLVLAGWSAQAQVTVRLDPQIPIANQPATAQVTFSGTNATEVTVFVRPVGDTNYQELAATDEGENTWRVELPFVMPPQGIDVFSRYIRNGETLTKPEQSPALLPFRIPALSLSAQSDVALPARQYRMISIPFLLEAPTGLPISLGSSEPIDVFGDDFGASADPSLWRVLRWSPSRLRYSDAFVDRTDLETRIRPGRGFWIITSEGGPFDVERSLSAGVAFESQEAFPAPVTFVLSPGWNQIGNPYLFPIQWDDVGGAASVEDPIAYRGSYTGLQSTLAPWEGYFVFNPGRSDVSLAFNALPSLAERVRTGSVAERLRERAGLDAAVLHVRAQSDTVTDAVFLGLSDSPNAAERPLQLHKPPAVDNGLRLALRQAGEDWLTRFHTPDDASWTLELTMPPTGSVSLRFEALGNWPGSLVVDDLDQGAELAIHDGVAEVPALSGVSTRRLQIRSGLASLIPPVLVLEAPRPNPSVNPVTVPYTLPSSGSVQIEILDVLGRTVRVLHDGEQDAGPHTIEWSGHDASGRAVAAGTYLLRMRAGGQSATIRITRLQ